MRTRLISTLSIIILTCLVTAVQAAPLWTCRATNARGAVYVWKADSRAVAVERALGLCHGDSVRPGTCRVGCVPNSWPSYKGMYRCVARDSAGKKWVWHATNKQNAIQIARQACQANSAFPGSCGVAVGDCSLQ